MRKVFCLIMMMLFLVQLVCAGGVSSLAEEIRTAVPGDGQVYMWWLGQAGWVVKSKDLTILIDPYLGPARPDFKRLFPTPVQPEDLSGIDYIFSTHQHLDHFDEYSIPRLMEASPECKLVVEASCMKLRTVSGYPAERVIGVTRSEAGKEQYYEYPWIKFKAVKAWHELTQDAQLKYFYVGYVITIGNVSIYHTGDTQYRSSMPKDAGKVDVLMAPINAKWGNMPQANAIRLVEEISPEVMLPMHWGMVAENTVDPHAFVKLLKENMPKQTVIVPKVGKRIVFP